MKGVEQIGWLYDAAVGTMNRLKLGAWRRRLVADLQGDVLEIGVGTGLNLAFYRAGTHVTALDPNPDLLAIARRRAHPRGYQLQVADAQALPFAADTFDAVVTTLVFCTIPDPRQALHEIRRVLRPGGRLVQLEHTRTGRDGPDRFLSLIAPTWQVVTGGCHLNRDTPALLDREGWHLLQHERRAGGLIRLLVSTPGDD
jgi:ubiquinone/menaquinone biosynthesis C-methylase UbiE